MTEQNQEQNKGRYFIYFIDCPEGKCNWCKKKRTKLRIMNRFPQEFICHDCIEKAVRRWEKQDQNEKPEQD